MSTLVVIQACDMLLVFSSRSDSDFRIGSKYCHCHLLIQLGFIVLCAMALFCQSSFSILNFLEYDPVLLFCIVEFRVYEHWTKTIKFFRRKYHSVDILLFEEEKNWPFFSVWRFIDKSNAFEFSLHHLLFISKFHPSNNSNKT